MIIQKKRKKKSVFIFLYFIYFYYYEFLYSNRRMMNYNSKHVSSLFPRIFKRSFRRDCKLCESTEFEDERVRKQWTERLIIPKAWLPVSPIASFVARSTHKQPFLPGREKPRNNIHEYRSRNTTSGMTNTQLI